MDNLLAPIEANYLVVRKAGKGQPDTNRAVALLKNADT